MIARQIVITHNFVEDELTGIGVCECGDYVRFDVNGVKVADITPAAVADEYFEKGMRLPAEFDAARAVLAERIAKIQALL